MSSHYVYVIVNKINLKLYFGSHSWKGTGVDKNYYGSGKIIKQAVNKYGKDNFIVYPIKFYDSVEECRRAEEELLTKYNIANNIYCYNLKNSAIGSEKGCKLSEEHKQKISQAITGEKHPNYGKHHTEETRKKISQALKGENNPMYGRTGENNPMYGKHHTEESRKKMSKAQKGKIVSEETRKKMSQLMKGENNPMYGKKLSEKRRKNLLQATNYRKTPLVVIDKNGKVKIFESQNECSRVLGVNLGNINSCLKGRYKTAGGYSFKYIEQLESGIYEGIAE